MGRFLLNREKYSHLFEVKPTPEFLWAEAESLAVLEHLPWGGLAIVGTREPSLASMKDLDHWMLELKNSGLVIVSGFARGIDQRAHEAALAAGLPTVAVLGAGLDWDYPPGSRELRKRILASGGVFLSEFECDSRPYPSNFLERNRLIAAWSKATWVVEAGSRSGTLNTAKWARDFGRDCYALPCYPGHTRFAGNQKLLDQGEAFPFWGPHSFGATWPELSGLGLENQKHPGVSPEIRTLIRSSCERANSRRSFSLEHLMESALEKGLVLETTLARLEEALNSGYLKEEQGLFWLSK